MDKYIYGIKCWDKFPDITTSIETITPQVAIAMLERNINNRNLKKNNQEYIGAMQRGEWKVNGETIIFDRNGNLSNGQHRLDACVKSGVPFTTLVVRGVEPSSQETMDAGRKRTLSDFLKMRGVTEYTEASTLCKALMRKDDYGLEFSWKSNGYLTYTTTQCLEFFDKNYETRIKPLVRKTKKVSGKYKGLSSVVVGPIFDELRNISIEDFECFCGMLTGTIAPTRTVAELITKLLNNAASQTRLPHEYLAAYIVKAWNCFINGTELQNIRYQPGGAKPEPFPTISHGIDRDEGRDAA